MQGRRRAFLDLYRSLTDLGLSSSLWLLLVLPHATLFPCSSNFGAMFVAAVHRS